MQHELLDDCHEMTKRYSNTYIGATVEGVQVPIQVNQFFKDDDSIIYVQDKDGATHKASDVNLTRPLLGVFNVGKCVVFLSLPAIRQWKRGFILKHTKTECRFYKELDAAHHRTPSPTNILKSIYNPQYPSVKESLKDVRSFQTVARAFSPKFYFGFQYNASEILVFYKKWIVGFVNENDEVMLKSHHLFEELSQYMKVRKI